MDPDAALEELRRLAKENLRDTCATFARADSERLSELVLALDDWIRGGGFLPAAWSKKCSK